jgi:hypothetical protein
MLKQDRSSTHLKAMKLLCILYALTTRSPFRYPWHDFNADFLETHLFILHWHYVADLFSILAMFRLMLFFEKDLCVPF